MEHIVTDANFDAEVLKSNVPVLVDFWAPWCGPCRAQAPILEEFAAELDSTKGKIAKLNVDENSMAGSTYGVMSIPTIIVFKDGKEMSRSVGVQEKAQLMALMGL